MLRKIIGGAMAGAFLLASGCSLRVQAPIRPVAYDFSDHDFYDRAYAPSPAYRVDATPKVAMAEGRGHRGHVERAPAKVQTEADGAIDDDVAMTEDLGAPAPCAPDDPCGPPR